jgi:DNA-binding MarR family transcriptional regulator
MSDAHRVAVRTLARLSRVLEAADAGLTVPQYRMLSALSVGGLRAARLAERLAIRKPTATALADGLDAAEAAYVAKLLPLLHDVPDESQFLDALRVIGAALDARLAAKEHR